MGLLMDGWNSMIRYYKNNFSDGFRQVQHNNTTTFGKMLIFVLVFSASFHLNCACHSHDDFCLALQDSIDLFLGNFALDETNGPTPLRVQKDWKFLTVSISSSLTVWLLYRFLIPFCVFLQLPIIMLVAFSMCIVCLLMAGKILDTRDGETGRIFQQRCRKLTEINVTLFNVFILLKLIYY